MSLGLDDQASEVNGVAREASNLAKGHYSGKAAFALRFDMVAPTSGARCLVCLHLFPLSRDHEHALPLWRRGYLAHQSRGILVQALRNMVGDINSHSDLLLTVRQAAIRLVWLLTVPTVVVTDIQGVDDALVGVAVC